jgi:uncharacterized protein YbjT (DUF2867 family)
VLVLVIGASSEVGARVASTLAARGVSVRAMVRRPEVVDAARALGAADVVVADLEDPGALDRAFSGARQVFLVSSPGRNQVTLEGHAIDTAEHAGTEHIVKISNIPIAGLDSGLHGNHRAIEQRLADSPIEATILQPSFFASVLARQVDLLRQHKLVLPVGRGRIAWIDPRDIADVAAAILAGDAPRGGARILTGPEALDGDELASRLGARRLDPPIDEWRASVLDRGMDRWLVDSTVHLYEAIARGALSEVSPEVENVLRRPPRPIDDWIADVLVPQLQG